MTLTLGPFELIAPRGRGAMAEVWQAVHHAQGVEVAVKVVTAPIGQHEQFRALFGHELRAVARLDHPGVVRLYDYGEVGAEVATASGERLPRGASYLVMEWLDGGPLSAHAGRMAWPAVRAVLLGLLDALGHAHARGVIHRDLKPDNVLLAGRGPVLTDFGVAYTAERATDPGRGAFAGTPNYMAPEQVTGDMQALGPWTDLYALGCLAHALVQGRPPFDGASASEVARAQLLAPVPALAPGLPAPDGFEAWLWRMLAKRPRDRFRFAADAAVALMALPDDAPPPPDVIDATEGGAADITLVGAPVFLSVPVDAWAAGPTDEGRPPFPAEWRRPTPPPTPPPLSGVGRALFGLRAPTLEGRDAERDGLWATLGEVAAGGGARVVLISGDSGLGKSRLAQWLGRQAHELGVADTLSASYDAVEGPGSGLGAMLARHLRCEGLDHARQVRQIRARLGEGIEAELVEAVATVIAAGGPWESRPDGVRLSSPSEFNTVVCAALARLATARPLVVQLEDVHWSDEALEFCDHVLTARPALAVMVVATLRPEAVPDDRRLVLDRLTSRAAAATRVLGPLDDEAMARQLESRLPLDPALVARVVGLAAGNPLYAGALVEHWIRIGALDDGPAGFRLRPGFDEGIPEEVRSVWRVRLDAALPVDGQAIFEVAAALGQMVDVGEWKAACAASGLTIEWSPVEAMLDGGLIVGESDTRWSFAHPMLRDALLGSARRGGRLAGWHRACARALGDRGPGRRARHLIAAGDHAEALAPLLAVADAALERKQIAAAHRALVQRIRSLHALRRPRLDPDRVATRIRWGQLCRIRGSTTAAARHTGRAAAEAHALGDRQMYSEALLEHGRALGTIGGVAAGLPAVRSAADEAAAVGDGLLESRALLVEGAMLLASGRPAAAQTAYEAALVRSGGREGSLMKANVLSALADLERRGGDQERAARCAGEARSIYQLIGARWGQAHAANLLGDIARYQGDLSAAEAHYRESCQLYGGIGSFDAIAADGNLALVLIELGQSDEARRLLDHVVLRADGAHSHELSQIFRACQLPCLAADADWPAWDATFARIDALCSGALVEPDVARTACRAAEGATAQGDADRAAQAWDLAIAQFEGLGRAGDADAARAARGRVG